MCLSIVQVRVGSFLERRCLHTLQIFGAASLECPSSHPHPTTTFTPLRIWRSSYMICIRCACCLKLSFTYLQQLCNPPWCSCRPPTFQQKKSDMSQDTFITFMGQHNWLRTSSARLSTYKAYATGYACNLAELVCSQLWWGFDKDVKYLQGCLLFLISVVGTYRRP